MRSQAKFGVMRNLFRDDEESNFTKHRNAFSKVIALTGNSPLPKKAQLIKDLLAKYPG
jgi:hypothetical protein